jgi:predicted lipoprotein with Yx(FWY)xxD motif
MTMRTLRHDRSTMTRIRAAALGLGLGFVLAACAGGAGGADSDATGGAATDGSVATDGAVVSVADDATFGPILTDGSGMTLYLFTADSPGVSTCVDGCLAAWPPLLTDGEPVARGDADAGLLGTLTRDDGTMQVTYGGWPLYFFAADMAAGEVAGQGVNGTWFVVAPDGSAVEDGPGDESDSADTSGMEGSPAADDSSGYGY